MNTDDMIHYLTHENDASPSDRVPCSRYGRTTEECAQVAVAFAKTVARRPRPICVEDLDLAMRLVVNDHDGVEHTLINYHEDPESVLDYGELVQCPECGLNAIDSTGYCGNCWADLDA